MSADKSANTFGQSTLLQPNSTVIVLVLKTLFRLLSLYNLVVLMSASPLESGPKKTAQAQILMN